MCSRVFATFLFRIRSSRQPYVCNPSKDLQHLYSKHSKRAVQLCPDK